MMSAHVFTHSSQMYTPAGPCMSLRTWLRVLPQNEQRISVPQVSSCHSAYSPSVA
jgi:hypothetical protein